MEWATQPSCARTSRCPAAHNPQHPHFIPVRKRLRVGNGAVCAEYEHEFRPDVEDAEEIPGRRAVLKVEHLFLRIEAVHPGRDAHEAPTARAI